MLIVYSKEKDDNFKKKLKYAINLPFIEYFYDLIMNK